jgi:hypothetical protein
MKHFDDRTLANLDVVLEQTCRSLPNGGDHEVRKKVARRLLATARRGMITLGRLTRVARTAFAEATKPGERNQVGG